MTEAQQLEYKRDLVEFTKMLRKKYGADAIVIGWGKFKDEHFGQLEGVEVHYKVTGDMILVDGMIHELHEKSKSGTMPTINLS